MISVSDEFKQELENDNRSYLLDISFKLSDGTSLSMNESDIWDGGLTIEDATSSENTFDIGAAISTKATLRIRNFDEEFDSIVFEYSEVTIKVGLELEDGSKEYVQKGVYIVDSCDNTQEGTITIEALDYMSKFDKPYSSSLSYPATLGQIVRDSCETCGVVLLSQEFTNSDYMVNSKPTGDTLTNRDIIAFAAQIACKYAKCDSYGRLQFEWYDTNEVSKEIYLLTSDNKKILASDGTPIYAIVNAADEDLIDDNGIVTEIHKISGIASQTIAKESITITGIKVTASLDSDEEESYTYGESGYVLEISGNELIQEGEANTVATMIAASTLAMSFNTFNISCLSDPSIEAGDRIYVIGSNNKLYKSYITSNKFTIGAYETISCGAETPSKKNSASYSSTTKLLEEAKKNTDKKISSYDLAVQQLTSLITQSFGIYKTEEVQSDKSIIYYMHNKPTLAESKTIWKMTADAFSVSTDEGKTWNAGIDSSGNAVVNVLSAVGVQAEWIEATDLSVIGANISGFKMYDGYLTRQVDLYPDMTADGLADLTDDTIVTRIINIRAGKSATADAILVYDKTKAQYLNNSGYNVEYRLRYDGYMYCKNASVSGEIEAKTGTIGNFTITDGNLTAEGEKGKISFESDEEEAGYINLDGQNMTIGGWYIAIRGRSVEVDATAGGLSINGDFYATGTKSRSVETSNYGKILQYCYEMPSPMFGDIGTGIIDDTGKCYIYLEEMFSETVSSDCEYYVFLQKEGQGDLWIEENAKGYFIVSGTPGLRFSWEAKARQKDYEYERLEPAVSSNEEPEVDYEEQAINYLENYEKELYGYEEIN